MTIVRNPNGCPIIESTSKLPIPGRYYAMITDIQHHCIEPVYEDQEFCTVVTYKLVHEVTLDVYEFYEAYYPYNDNPRTNDFVAFLKTRGYNLTDDFELVGIRTTVDIVYEVLGSCIHPVISYRPWWISQQLSNCADETCPL